MGELGAFLKIERVPSRERDPAERRGDYREFVAPLPEPELREQGASHAAGIDLAPVAHPLLDGPPRRHLAAVAQEPSWVSHEAPP